MKQIDIRDFTNYHYPTIFTPAPDGKHAVMAVVDANEKDNCYESCLWPVSYTHLLGNGHYED